MTPQQHNDLDIPRPSMPRRRVLQSLLGGTLVLVSLAGCGGGDDEEEEEEGQEQENEEEEDD